MVSYSFDYAKIDELYDFYEIKTSQKHFDTGSYLLDSNSGDIKIRAISFYLGNRFLLMMSKNTENDSKIKGVLSAAKEAQYLSCERKSSSNIEQYKLAQLLLNNLGNFNSDAMSFNNLTGHLYCFHPAWLEKRTKNEETIIYKIPTLEIAISKDNKLILSVHTFTSEMLRKKIDFGKKKFEEYPKYILSAHYTLRRKLVSDKEPGFLMRQTINTKKEIPFIDISNYEKFSQSKMGMLDSVLTRFNNQYAGIAKINLSEIDNYASFDIDRSVLKENAKIITDYLKDYKIRIVDQVNSDTSTWFCKELKSIIESKYVLSASIGKRTSEDALNICVIHNKDYYDGVGDPHQKQNKGVVQHVTIEDFLGHEQYAIQTVFNELLVKKDLESGRIRLYDWTKLSLEEPISFGLRQEKEDSKQYWFMDVDPDGRFRVHEEELTLFNDTEYNQMISIFDDAVLNDEKVLGVLKYKGYYCRIVDTDIITIPEIEEIRNQLKDGNRSIRNIESREALMKSILDIKSFTENEEDYYFVGAIGYGMNRSMSKASSVNKLVMEGNSRLEFEQLLPLMSVTFVRNGQLTVVPFPFKYLREYIIVH